MEFMFPRDFGTGEVGGKGEGDMTGLAGVFIPIRREYVRLLRAIKKRYMIRFMRGTIR